MRPVRFLESPRGVYSVVREFLAFYYYWLRPVTENEDRRKRSKGGSSLMNIATSIAVCTLSAIVLEANTERPDAPQTLVPYPAIRNVTLEMSLKPFNVMDEAYISAVCEEMFRQWWPLTRHAEQVSVLLWTADGSEILDYRGELEAPIEWARYIGIGNWKIAPGSGPPELSLHERPYFYTENPPVVTYEWLKRITAIIKRVGGEQTGKPVRVGATFDPGPEFAKSSFKFERHPEVCLGDTAGKGTFVCCYSVLRGDTVSYAGFPEGIPEGTPFGTFFGRQCQHFLADLGFDYIWFSNGFGFGLEAWGVTGAVFDGETFTTSEIAGVRDKILDFWQRFRQECPQFPIETRGTNLAAGMDLASDGVPLRDIYRGGFNMAPPPNSPWAALDGDFGLELVGHMSRIAEIPGDRYPFRYYTHDPWWLNSPWLDRYGREPHDIYLPMAVARVTERGETMPPTDILFLTIDNSYGEMPVEVPNEVIPHILRGRADSPDQPGPVVWVYPFDEYHDMTFGQPARVDEVLFGDWFMRQAVNTGFPLNTVITAANLPKALAARPEVFRESVLVSIVPDTGSAFERTLLDMVKGGGKVLLYGPTGHASDTMLSALNLRREQPLDGELQLALTADPDIAHRISAPTRLHHRPLTCAGGVEAVLADAADAHTEVRAAVANDAGTRVIALSRALPEWNGGVLAWVRGTNSNHYRPGARLLATDNPNEWFAGEQLMRHMLTAFGYTFAVDRREPGDRAPMVCVARCRNGFFFSGYHADTTVTLRLRFPQGAPLLVGFETILDGGCSTYTMPRAWHRECRVFVEQADDSKLACREMLSGHYGVRRRIQIQNLQNATVRFYPETGTEERVAMVVNSPYPYVENAVEFSREDGPPGCHCLARDVTGTLIISW